MSTSAKKQKKSTDDFFSPNFDLEKRIFDPFIGSLGGQRVTDVFTIPPGLDNCDYYFEPANVLAELKILRTEFAQAEKFKRERSQIINRWFRDGRADPRWLTGKTPNVELDKEIFKALADQLRSRLKHANGQIKAVRDHFRLNGAQGLIIIVNDGFFEIPPMLLPALVGEVLRRFTSTNGFVLINLRNRLQLRGFETRFITWNQWYNDTNNIQFCEFVEFLGSNWRPFLEKLAGTKFKINIVDNDPARRLLMGSEFSDRPVR